MENVYDKNKTMRLLGYQCYGDIVTEEDRLAIAEIIDANLNSPRPDISFMKYDIFALGYIQGKRAARREKKSKK